MEERRLALYLMERKQQKDEMSLHKMEDNGWSQVLIEEPRDYLMKNLDGIPGKYGSLPLHCGC